MCSKVVPCSRNFASLTQRKREGGAFPRCKWPYISVRKSKINQLISRHDILFFSTNVRDAIPRERESRENPLFYIYTRTHRSTSRAYGLQFSAGRLTKFATPADKKFAEQEATGFARFRNETKWRSINRTLVRLRFRGRS